jgi:hypothetical protein
VLTLPDSRRIELTSRSTLVRLDGLEHDASRDEVVTTLYVRRPLEPCRYQEAVADMLATIRSLGVEPHARMIEMTREGDIPGREKRSGPLLSRNAKGVDLEDGTRVHCTLTPDPERGWFVLYIINSNRELWPSVIEREAKQRFHRQRATRRVLSSQRSYLPQSRSRRCFRSRATTSIGPSAKAKAMIAISARQRSSRRPISQTGIT